MSVGGMVVSVGRHPEYIWVNTREILRWKTPDGQYPPELGDACAIKVENNSNSRTIAVGDSLWWQGFNAYWTPRDQSGRVDVPIPRISNSHPPAETDRCRPRG